MSAFDLTRIDHLNLAVSDMERSRAFYTPALAAFVLDPDGINVEAVSHGSAT